MSNDLVKVKEVLHVLALIISIISVLNSFAPSYGKLLPNLVRLPRLQNQMWLTLRQVQDHLRKVAICPCEPRTSIYARVVNVDALVNQSQSASILQDSRESLLDLVIVVGAKYARDLAHGPRISGIDVRATMFLWLALSYCLLGGAST